MNLLLDFGNTRLKWALVRALTDTHTPQMVRRGAVAYDVPDLAVWRQGMADVTIRRIDFSSVVSATLEQLVWGVLEGLASPPNRFQVGLQQGSLQNAYATPETLGVDRWAAAIGAWGLNRQSCLVVCAGTATTIDLIERSTADQAVYRGGLILPGIDLMLAALHQRAANLPQATGQYCAAPKVPNNTHDAMVSGAIEATCGAIERMAQRLPDTAPWLITGGNAAVLQAALRANARVVNDLVLEGLALSQSALI